MSKWLILGSHIPPEGQLGGMIRYTVEVTRALEARPDVEVHVHCQQATVPFMVAELGIDHRRLHPSATGSTVPDSLMEQYGLGGLVTSIQPSVVLGTKQLLPLRDVSSVHLLTVHDMLPMDRPQDFGLLKRHLLPPAYRRSIAQADVLACVSHASRDRLLTHIPDAADRAVVVANAMTSALGTTPATPLADLTRQSFALVVGDRSRRKNVGFIVDLWPEVVARHPDARLVLVGPPGWGHNEELPALTRLFDRGSVVEAGFVTDSELRWAYENAVATLCPSRLEGFGLPVVEALSLGCPVILSTDPAQVEASAGLGTAVDLADRERWIDTIVDHFGQHRRPPVRPPGRSWAEVAEELVAASTNRIRSAAAQ